ncbi:MAG: zinc ribbon domain-containing protein [Chloroflexi bacterium]|nr:zinc ribbon domain-containing protein [Chloroflexota bacterium]
MPRYEFCCENCGLFEHWRSFDEASVPMICPQCQAVARRVYTTPGLVKTPAALAHAMYRAEKSAYEPEVVRQEHPVPQEEKPSQVMYQSHGRPWQIGH